MRRAAFPALLVAAASAAIAVACRDDAVSPEAAGSISIQIVLSDGVAADLAGRLPAPGSDFVLFGRLEAARARAIGPTNRTVNLTESPSGDSFSGTIDGLSPGTYTVIVEGLIGGQVDYYGETSGVSVTAGRNSTATVPFASFRPGITSLPERTASRAFEVCYGSVPDAESYRVEWARNLDFSGLSSATTAGMCAAIEVSDYGKHYVRVRAVNSTVTAGGRPGDPDSVDVVAASVTASGTVMEASETEIRQGGAALILTLADDTWLPEVGGDNPVTRGLLDGIDSQGAEPLGWDAVVKAGLSFMDVSRVSDAEVQITLPPFPEYDISEPETITPTAPAEALTQSVDNLTAQASFQVAVTAGSAQLAGTVTDDSELDIRGGGSTLVITLIDDGWVPEVGGDNAITRALLDGLASDGGEAAGWNAVVRPGLTAANVLRVSDTEVAIEFPAFPGYDITSPEQVTATVPAGALVQSQDPLTASPPFTIAAAPGLTVEVTGSGTVTSEPPGIACPDDCAEDYAGETTVTLTATAEPYWHFSGWGGACTGTTEPVCDVVMTQAQDVLVTFVRDTFRLATTVTGVGTLTSDPPGIACPGDCDELFPSETPVTLLQQPEFGWTFEGWSGDCTGTGLCEFLMTQDRNVTGTFAGPQWIDVRPGGGPPDPRSRHSAVYIEGTNQMVVFGGNVPAGKTNDLWSLSEATGTTPAWRQELPGGDPPPLARDGHSAVYDPTSDRMIVFGGSAEDNFFFNDLWVLAGVSTGDPAWIQLLPDGPLPGRHGHTAVYNPATNQMTVFGGQSDETGLPTNEVWVLSNANGTDPVNPPTWKEFTPLPGPPPRMDATAVYDPNTNRMTLFGGSDPSKAVAYNDVWVLLEADGTGDPSWLPIETMGDPPEPRAGHSAVYHPDKNIMTVYGPRGDIWVLLDANALAPPEWQPLIPEEPQAPARESHAAIYDVRSNRMVIFGGLVGGSLANDVWALTRPNGLVP